MQALAPSPPFIVGMVLLAVFGIMIVALTYRVAARFFAELVSDTSVADMKIATPQAFLSPLHALFGCVLLFGIASGFGLTLNEVAHAPIGIGLAGAIVLLLVSWLVLRGDENSYDALFSFAVLLVIGGFILASFVSGSESAASNALMRLGGSCFSILMWLVVASIGKQNPFALISSLCVVFAARTLGVVVGAVAGHLVNDFFLVDKHFADLMVAASLFAFIAFLWVGLRNFSFTQTIRGIERPSSTKSAVVEESVEKRCREIGQAHSLTDREVEIFAMLARGRNGSFIQNHYVVSRNTVKTHVKHIYRKLDVHSQQELIDLVENHTQ